MLESRQDYCDLQIIMGECFIMKKIASIALLALVPLTLASCGSGNQKSDSQSSNATSKTEKVSKKASSKASSKKDQEASSSSKANSDSSSSAKDDQTSSSVASASSSTSKASNSAISSSSKSENNHNSSNKTNSNNLSRADLTAAEQQNNHQPLADETIQTSEAAINLVKAKYGDKGWKVAYSSVGKSSPIYFHVTSDHDGSYYVYANGVVQNAGGDLSDHASEIQNIK